MTLAQLKAASQQQLSRAVGVDPRNAVPIVDSLQQRGLIERRVDPADRRRHAITLTRAGQVQIEQLGRAGNELEDWFLASLTDEERPRRCKPGPKAGQDGAGRSFFGSLLSTAS
jgi:DNA-binding MarR family transcriptional regulator